MPIIMVFKENKNNISIIVKEKPSYGLKKNLLIKINTKKTKIMLKEKIPSLVIKLAGPAVEDNKASKPYLIKNITLDLDLPFFLKGLSNWIDFCLAPMKETSHLKNLVLSLIFFNCSIIFLSSNLKSPVFSGMVKFLSTNILYKK